MLRLAHLGEGQFADAYALLLPRLTNAKMVAVVDADSERAQRLTQRFNCSITTTTLGKLLADHANDVDAILIHGNVASRTTLCLRALEAGKHVLVDLPFLDAKDSVQTLLASAQLSDAKLMIGQETRYLPAIQTVRESLDSGSLGIPGLIRLHRWEATTERDWLKHQLIRDLDLVTWLFNHSPTDIYARGDETNYLQIHLGFSEGGMALIDVSSAIPPGGDYFSLSVIGSTGAAYADDHHNAQLLFRGGDPSALITGQGHTHVLAQLREFIAAIEENREPSMSLIDGIRPHLIAEGVTQSLMSGAAVQWKGDRYEQA